MLLTRYTAVITQFPRLRRVFVVSATTVPRRLQGRTSKSSRLPSNRALKLEQPQSIRDHIERLDEQNVSEVSMICAAANFILAKSHSDPLTTPPQVSKMWTKRFLNRNPQFYKKKQKPPVVERKNAHNENDFQEYFEKYKDIRLDKGIADEIWMRLDFAQAVSEHIGL